MSMLPVFKLGWPRGRHSARGQALAAFCRHPTHQRTCVGTWSRTGWPRCEYKGRKCSRQRRVMPTYLEADHSARFAICAHLFLYVLECGISAHRAHPHATRSADTQPGLVAVACRWLGSCAGRQCSCTWPARSSRSHRSSLSGRLFGSGSFRTLSLVGFNLCLDSGLEGSL